MSKDIHMAVGFGPNGCGEDADLLYIYVFDTKAEAEAFVTKVESINDGVNYWEIQSDPLYVHAADAAEFHKNWVEA